MTLSDSCIVRIARIGRRALGGATFFALVSCTSSDEPGGSSAHGGNSTGGDNAGGTTATGGTSGSPATASGGMSNSAGGEGGGGGVAVGGAGGAGGTAVSTSPACAVGAATNTSGLAVKRPEIGARKLGNLAIADVIRIDRDPKSGDIVYMNRGGKFWKVDPTSGMSTSTEAGYTGGTDHRGMAFGPDGTLYTLSHNTNGGVIIRKGAPGATRAWSTLLTSAPYNPGNTTFDHWFAGVIVSPDNMSVYFSSGSRSDHGEIEAGEREVPLTSAIFKVPASSNNLVLANDETALKSYLYADGLRNSFDMAWNAEGELFAGENGPDMDLPDEINWIREGKNYGFPWRFGNEDSPALDPQYTPVGDTRLHTGFFAADQKKWVYDAAMPPKPATPLTDPIINHGPDCDHMRSSRTANVEDASMKGMPLAGITGHRSPLGIGFDVKGVLCGDYYKSGFVLSYGALLDVLQDGGQDLALLQMTKVNGEYEMTTNVIVTGFTAPVDSVLVDNKLYVVENRFMGTPGAIYEITFPVPAK